MNREEIISKIVEALENEDTLNFADMDAEYCRTITSRIISDNLKDFALVYKNGIIE